MKKPVDLVMFDLDGTLADTGHDLAGSVNFTRARFDLEPLPERSIHAQVGRGVDILAQARFAGEKSRRFSTGPASFSWTLRTAFARSTVLYPGVRDMLDYFCAKRRVVVSNKM